MLLLLMVLFFIFGLFIGSFLNVIVDRLPIGRNPFKGRSHCDNCGKVLAAKDLVPLVSYLSLNGKCRYCNHRLSAYHPLVEFTTGVLFALVAFFGIAEFKSFDTMLIGYLIYSLLLISTLIVIFFTDLKFGIISANVVGFGVILVIIWHIFSPAYDVNFINYLYTGAGAFASFLVLFLVTRGRGMGFGDVVYAFLMGLLLGFPQILIGMYIAFTAGAIISVALVVSKKKKMKGGTIPFGPFLVLGTIVCLFWGDLLMSKALSYLLLR